MPAFVIDIIVIALLLLVNAFLAMTEMSIVSARKSKLLQMSEAGDKHAKQALDIAHSPTEFLSEIQIGITMVALLTGIFGGATIADDISDRLKDIPGLADYADIISISSVTAVLTYVSVIIGELVPKRIALSAPENIAKLVARPVTIFGVITKPLVWLLVGSTEAVVRAFGIKPGSEAPVTEAEIQVLVDQATEAGVFEEAEQEMVESVLRLDDKRASALMTPRREIEWLDLNDDESAWLETAYHVPHSRLVVAQGSLDKFLGVVETKALIRQKLENGAIDLNSLLAQPMYVPENMSALDLIQKFRNTRQQIAMVLDEYGGVNGLVSREDVFEAIVGDLPMPGEDENAKISQRHDGSFLCDGQVPIDVFKETVGVITDLPGEKEEDYRTLAGFVLYHFQRVPSEGDQFEWNDLQFEVIDMDRHRIDKLLIKRRIGS